MKKPDVKFVIPSEIFGDLYETANSFIGKIDALSEAMTLDEDGDRGILIDICSDISGIYQHKLDQLWERSIAERKEVPAR